MRFIADEHIPPQLAEELRARGHDVLEIRAAAPGARDRDVLRRARTEGRVVITRDKDFGALVFRERAGSVGVILLRLPWRADAARRVARIIDANGDRWLGCFSVVETGRIRSSALS